MTKLQFKPSRLKLYILFGIGIAIFLYLGFSLYVANVMTSRFQTRIDISPKIISENVEDISFSAQDGVVLQGWLFRGFSDRLVILVSGLLENRTNVGYYGGFLVRELLEKDYNVLVYDTRDFSTSTGTRVGYGSTEGRDVIGAVEYAKTRGFEGKNIGIIGYSTGAVSMLMIVAELRDVGALVLDSTAAVYKPVLVNVLSREKHIPSFFHPAIFFFAKSVFGVNIDSVRPIDTIELVPERKFLFLHAGHDKTIPVANSEALLKRANPASRLVIFPNGEHIETYKSDPELYKKEVFGFLEKQLR